MSDWDATPPTQEEMNDQINWTAMPPSPEELKATAPISQAESFARGAANNFPLAPQAAAALAPINPFSEKSNYSDELAHLNEAAAQAKAAHPITYGAGAVTGAAAPLLIPGVGEALEASPIAGNAALGAANAVSNKDLTKDAGQTIKDLAMGAGIGGAVGAAGKGIGSLFGGESPAAERIASRTTAQALDISPLAVRREAMAAGMSPEKFVTDLGQRANEAIPDLIEIGDSANSKLNKVFDAHDAAGKGIGELVGDMTKGTEGTFPEAQETINALRTAAKNYYQVDGGDLALAKTADRLEALQDAGKLDFDRLQQVKSAIGHGFKKADPPAGTEDIYGILKSGLQKAVDRLSVQAPEIAPQLQKLNQIYSVTSDLIPAMSRTAAREVAGANVGGGVMSKLIPSAIGGALGGPAGAALGGGAKYLQETIAPDLGKNLAYKTMNALRGSRLPQRSGQAILNELNDLLASKYANQQ